VSRPSVVPIEFVNLDVLDAARDTGQESYNNWLRLRAEGLDPLPVWHLHTDVKWLKKYLKKTDHLSISISGNEDRSRLGRLRCFDRIWEEYLIDKDRKPAVRVHGMGMTSFSLMQRYPWFSVDSATYLRQAIYGKLHLPRPMVDGSWDYRHTYILSVSFASPMNARKDQHFNTLGQKQQDMLTRYVKECGFEWGESRKGDDGEEVVVKPGIVNNYNQRLYLNMLCFSRSIHAYPWPRPLTVSSSGLFSVPEQGVTESRLTPEILKAYRYTRLYYSGGEGAGIEDFIRERPEEFENCGVMLTYYTQQAEGIAARRLKALRRGEHSPMKGAKEE